MGLEAYRAKRDFTRTEEPAGRTRAQRTGSAFVVQKHAARRLHYDFRLELDGVLKSWAVTRGPSLVPSERRLAVEVEDHPLDYASFEGDIPAGSYGAGHVEIWDKGTWRSLGNAHEGLDKGHLEFELTGKRLMGRWHLVRMKPGKTRKRRNWLLIKAEDRFAQEAGAPDVLETQAPALPDFVPPALATLVREPPAGPDWLHEIKLDGYRIQARLVRRRVTLRTRAGLDWTGRLGKVIPAALRRLAAKSALLDGEVVVTDAGGVSRFALLQRALAEGRTGGLVFHAFDLLELDGRDIRSQPLVERKRRLQALLDGAPAVLRYSEDFDESGDRVLHHACRLELEGLVSKRRDAPYRSGRTGDWLKSKCALRQEFVITGYVPSTAGDGLIGALALGYHEAGRLRHAGRVGTGFDRATARDLYRRLQPLRIAGRPYAKPLPAADARGLLFVRPELVAEVEFGTWTTDRKVRHASWRGLREDKPADEIIRDEEGTAVLPRARTSRPRLTHPERVYWPDAGVTKKALADYHAAVWPRMAPFVAGRPLALKRCPEGIDGPCFFQKHAWKGLSPAIHVTTDPADPGQQLLAVDDLDGMLGLVQAGTLELHPWGARLDDLERPDVLTFDLDPGEDTGWPQVVEAAREVRLRVEAAGLAAFLKTSGGKGLHVVVPLVPKARWAAAKAWARRLATAMAQDSPDRYVATMSKARRRGRIFIDWLRNARGATAVAPWSPRARPGAPVSMPVAWEELDQGIGPASFTLEDAVQRTADPWAGFGDAARALPAGRRT